MRTNKVLGALVNGAMMLVGLGLITVALWLLLAATYGECLLLYQLPFIVVGGALLLAAFVGFCGLACDSNALACLYLVVALVAVLGSTAFTIFAFLVTGSAPPPLTSRNQTVYATWGFSPWMQGQVGAATWPSTQSCLARRRTCADLRSYSPAALNGTLLPPIEAGCCVPPQGCQNRTFRPTFYSFAAAAATAGANPPHSILATAAITSSSSSSSSSRQNCSAFSIEPAALCYPCEYCKGGFLSQLHSHYSLEKYVSLGASIALLVLYLMACCAAFTGADDDDPALKSDNTAAAAWSAFQKNPSMTRVNTLVVAPGQFERSLSSKVVEQEGGAGGGGGVGVAAGMAPVERSLSRVDKPPGALDRSLTQTEKAVPGKGQYPRVNTLGGGYHEQSSKRSSYAEDARSRDDTRSRSSHNDDARSARSYGEDARSCRSSRSSERGKEVFVVEVEERRGGHGKPKRHAVYDDGAMWDEEDDDQYYERQRDREIERQREKEREVARQREKEHEIERQRERERERREQEREDAMVHGRSYNSKNGSEYKKSRPASHGGGSYESGRKQDAGHIRSSTWATTGEEVESRHSKREGAQSERMGARGEERQPPPPEVYDEESIYDDDSRYDDDSQYGDGHPRRKFDVESDVYDGVEDYDDESYDDRV